MLPNFRPIKKMIQAESLVIDPEFMAIIGIKAADMLELPKGSLDVKSNANFLGPLTLYGLIERFAVFDAASGKFRHLGRAGLGRKHDRVVMNGDHQREYAAPRFDK